MGRLTNNNMTRRLILTFLTFVGGNTTLAMEKAPSPTIPLVVKTAASLEAQRLNPPPPSPTLWQRRYAKNSANQATTSTNSEPQPPSSTLRQRRRPEKTPKPAPISSNSEPLDPRLAETPKSNQICVIN